MHLKHAGLSFEQMKSDTGMRIRLATGEDAEMMLDIYAPYIENTTITFETEVPSIGSFRHRVEAYLQKFPWLVAEQDGVVIGYAYASAYRDREAYQWSCECSVYMHEQFKGTGVAAQLYKAVFQILTFQGFRNVYAVIGVPNERSEKFHARCGFEHFALYKDVGSKFGKWYDVGWWKLQLNSYDLQPPPPLYFSAIAPADIQRLLGEGLV